MESSLLFPSLFFRQRLNALGISFLLGCFVLTVGKSGIGILSVSAVALFIGLMLLFFQDREGKITLLLLLVGLGCALFWMGLQELITLQDQRQIGKECCVEGYVTSADSDRYDLSLIKKDGEISFRKLRIPSSSPPSLGARMVLFGTLREAEEDALCEGVSFFLIPSEEETGAGKSLLYSAVGKLRNAACAALGEDRVGGFYRAILLGDRSALDPDWSDAFSQTGSAHLLAISGLHISQMIGFIYCLVSLLPISFRRLRILFLPLILSSSTEPTPILP